MLNFKTLFIIVIFAVSILLIAGFVNAEKPKHSILLNGLHRFNSGDDPSWASPDLDDSQWKKINIPGSRQSQGIRTPRGIGWHRIHFTAPYKIKDIEPAISLGRIGSMDEVFLNGVRVGSEGRMGERLVSAVKVERLYQIPEGLLRYNDINILSVRVMTIYRDGEIFEGDVILGDYRELLIDKLNRDHLRKSVETIFLILFVNYFLYYVFMYVSGLREKEYAYFGISTFILAISYSLNSLTFYETGMKTPFVQQIIYALLVVFPLTIFLFIVKAFEVNLNRIMRSFTIYSLVLSLTFLFFSTYNYSLDFLLYMLWIFQLLFLSSTAVYFMGRAYMRRRPESGPVFMGTIVSLLAVFVEITASLNIRSFGGITLNLYLLITFILCIMYALNMRIVRLRDSTVALSGRILTAHEEERRRLSMELHDGLGQGLLTAKFNLQRLNRDMNIRPLDGIIEDISGSINELRDISNGLMPPSLQEMGIKTVMEVYSKKFSEKTGINTTVSADVNNRPLPEIELNLFRIFQEALNNAAKHSGASHVKVLLQYIPPLMVMEIADDGSGFDYLKEDPGSHGIGLLTMKERVRLMGGSFTIESKKGRGTIIKLEVTVR